MVLEFPKRFEGKVVAITGGASGIGAAMTKRYIAEGAKVLVADMCDDTKGKDFVSRFSQGKAYFHRCDISDAAQATSVVTKTIEQFGDIDIIHNNAAAVAWGQIPDMDFKNWSRVFQVGLDAPFHICQAAIPYMKQQAHKKTRGVIINTISSAGMIGDEGLGCYAAAKAGLANLTRSMAADHAPDGIRINGVAPGWTNTAMSSALAADPEIAKILSGAIPMDRPGEPDELAAVMLFLASDDASYVTGSGKFVLKFCLKECFLTYTSRQFGMLTVVSCRSVE
jgi:meso-butanediol dehydrogenase/(S,S)-butanediol dehydrogenase/diacetyl reductase